MVPLSSRKFTRICLQNEYLQGSWPLSKGGLRRASNIDILFKILNLALISRLLTADPCSSESINPEWLLKKNSVVLTSSFIAIMLIGF